MSYLPAILLTFLCLNIHTQLFSVSEYLNLLFLLSEVLFLQIVPWLTLLFSIGDQLKYYLLGGFVPSHPSWRNLCIHSLLQYPMQKIWWLVSKIYHPVFFHWRSNFLSPVFLFLARWIVMTNLANLIRARWFEIACIARHSCLSW